MYIRAEASPVSGVIEINITDQPPGSYVLRLTAKKSKNSNIDVDEAVGLYIYQIICSNNHIKIISQ